MSLFQPYLNPRRMLVDPCDRLQFAVPLLLLTILIHWLLTASRDHGLLTGLTAYASPPFVQGALLGALWGTAFGVMQWRLLRKYIPDSRWVIAVILGYMFVWGGGDAISDILYQSALGSDSRYHDSLIGAQIRFVAAAIAAPLCLVTGLLQWIVLRRYVVSARWWIVLPLFSYCVYLRLNTWLYFGGSHLFQPFRLDFIAFLGTIDIIIFAISFCSLVWSRGQSVNLDEQLTDSPLASAAKIEGFWTTRSLILNLEKRLDEAWKAETSYGETLSYLLGVNAKGAIVDCIPGNQASTTFIDQTPLPLLMQAVDLGLERQSPLARIQVSFDALGQLKIRNCRNVSILEMASILMLLGMLISFYPTWWSALIHR